MEPIQYNIVIYQGTTFYKTFQWLAGNNPVDLTGVTARMHIRKKVNDPNVILSLTTENGRLAIQSPTTDGKFEIKLTPAETSVLNFKNGVYDLELVFPGGEPVYRMVEGNVELKSEVTR